MRRTLRLYTWAFGVAAALAWFVVPFLTGATSEAPSLVGLLFAVLFVGMLIAMGAPRDRRTGDGARRSRDARSSRRTA